MGSMELINHCQSVSWKCKSIHFKTSCSILTQTQKMFEVAGNSGNHLIQSPCSRQVTWSWLPRTVPICFLMCLRMETLQLLWATCAHCSVTHTAKKTHFLMFRGTLLCFSVCFSQKCGVAVFSVRAHNHLKLLFSWIVNSFLKKTQVSFVPFHPLCSTDN